MRNCGSQRFKSILSIVTILVAVGVLEFRCGKKEPNPVLAKFDGGVVRENDYVDHYLLSTKYKPEVFPTEENLKDIVTKKALERIAVKEALAKGLDKDSTYQETVRSQARKIVFYRYMQKEMIGKVITDSLMKEFYDNYSPQYHMRYIIRPVVKTSTPEFARSQKDTIELVYRLLKSGKKFEDLAKAYSQDITTNQKGGDLGFVIRESLGDAALRAVMDTLMDFAYSKPFRGYEGYYILYKGEQRHVPVPSFDELRDRIWKTLYRTRRHNIQQEVDKRFSDLRQKYNYQFFDAVRKAIFTQVGADEKTSVFKALDFSVLNEQDLAQALARYDGGVIRVSELFENRKRAPQTILDFDEQFSSIAEQHLLGQHALELGIQNEPEISAQVETMKEALLRDNLTQMMVRDKVSAKVDSLRKTLSAQLKAEELKTALAKRRFEIETAIRQEFKEGLKEKYRFQFVSGNFAQALKRAQSLKIEQNQNAKTSAKDSGAPE